MSRTPRQFAAPANHQEKGGHLASLAVALAAPRYTSGRGGGFAMEAPALVTRSLFASSKRPGRAATASANLAQ